MLTHHPSDPHRLGHGPFRRRCLLKESLPHPGPVCRYAQPAQFRRPTRLIVTRCYYRVASGFHCHPRVSGNVNGSNFLLRFLFVQPSTRSLCLYFRVLASLHYALPVRDSRPRLERPTSNWPKAKSQYVPSPFRLLFSCMELVMDIGYGLCWCWLLGAVLHVGVLDSCTFAFSQGFYIYLVVPHLPVV